MRLVVTGGAGFIGSHLVDALVASRHQVDVIDDLSSGRREQVSPDATLYVLDVASRAAGDLVRELRPDAVFHLAAQASVTRSMADPLADMRANVGGTVTMLEAAAAVGARVLVASTAAVYGVPDEVPVAEDVPLKPVSPYAASKLAAELYLAVYAAQGRLEGAALRYANVYGPRQRSHGEGGVVAIFSAALAEGRQVSIEGDGRQTRDFVYVDDVVGANLAVMESAANGVFNVSTGRETDILTLFELLREASRRHTEPSFAAARPRDLPRSALRPEALRRATGFASRVPIEQGLRATYEWFAARAESAPAER